MILFFFFLVGLVSLMLAAVASPVPTAAPSALPPIGSLPAFVTWLVATGVVAAIVAFVLDRLNKSGVEQQAGTYLGDEAAALIHHIVPANLWPIVRDELKALAADPRFSDASVNDVAIHILAKYAPELGDVALEDVVRAVGNFVSAFRGGFTVTLDDGAPATVPAPKAPTEPKRGFLGTDPTTATAASVQPRPDASPPAS